ncbi:L-threonylcarbamoyladenylate synthase [candidate division KSB1 bacterium]
MKKISTENFEDAVGKTVSALKRGEIIVYPTETVYGIGADCTNESAVNRLYLIKKRDPQKPVLLVAADVDMVKDYVKDISDMSKKIIESFWPGPLTVVFKAGDSISGNLTAGTGTIGIRVPDNRFCREMSCGLGKPVVSTSANISGEKFCSKIEDISEDVLMSVDLIIDAGKTKEGIPSTVISLTGEKPVIIRQGAVSEENLREFMK